MKKLCFAVSSVEAATEALEEVRKLGISDESLHVIANDKIELGDLPEADITEENDIVGGAARGAVAGTATGMIAGLLAATIPGAGIIAASGIATGAVGGASFGVWIGSMIGSSVPNSQLEEWQHLIDRGDILVIVETPDELVASVEELLEKAKYEVIAFAEKDDSIPIT